MTPCASPSRPPPRRRPGRTCSPSGGPPTRSSCSSRPGRSTTSSRSSAIGRSRASRVGRTLAALAQATTRIRVGVMVTGTPYRHPAVLANMAATVDIVSGGRLELGLGAGWNETEANAYGIDLLPAAPAHGPVRRGLRRRRRPADPAPLQLRGRALHHRRRLLRAQGRPAAAPADLHRRQRREADAADRRPPGPALELPRRAGGRVRAPARACSTPTARTSGATPARS